jgi:hypothetical protein
MKRILLILLSLFLVTNITLLSGTKGKVAGRLTDAISGEPLPFVNVMIMGTNLGAASDIDGYYSILNITPGVYTVKASAIGYNSVSIQEVKVSIDLTTTIDFQLTETSVELEGEIVVVATRELIRKDLTSSTSIVGDDVISQLPVTDIGDVLQLQAGVVISGGNIHIRGGRSNQVAYQIDGVPVTDVYDGSTLVNVNQNAVQELQVISGAFNAEYGQAQSGVVNIVTKDGNNDFNFNVQVYTGDYVSNRTEIYDNIDNINPVAIRNFEGSLSGPIIQDDLFFYLNGRYYFNTGSYHDYNHFNKLTPDNNLNRFNKSYTNILAFNHAISSNSFYTLNLSYTFKDYRHYIFEDIYTGSQDKPTNYEDNSTVNTPPYSFGIGGTDSGEDSDRFTRNTGSYAAKLDWVTQINQEINLQFGGNFAKHRMYLERIDLVPMVDENGQRVVPYNVSIPLKTTTDFDTYLHEPYEASGYVQSKFEAFNLIFNLGIRFDYFQPDGVILSDPTDPNIFNPLKPNNRRIYLIRLSRIIGLMMKMEMVFKIRAKFLKLLKIEHSTGIKTQLQKLKLARVSV